MSTAPFYFDCDTGIDDALALGYLLASPSAELVGIGTVSGNVSAGQAATNTLNLLALAGRSDVDVAVGEHDFLTHDFDGGATHVHGDRGIGGVELPTSAVSAVGESAAEMIVRLARAHKGELRIIAVGPLTNLAVALRLEPNLPALVKELTIMGGATNVPGNVTAVAEANIINDPEAAAIVFEAAWPIVMVGLDVTMESIFEARHRAELIGSGKPVAVALGEMLDVYFDFYVTVFGRRVSALHDPLAVGIAVGDVKLSHAPLVNVEVDASNGPGRGQTIADLRGRYLGHPRVEGAHTRVVLGIDGDFAALLVTKLLTL